MTENQHNKKLLELRNKIDEIDLKIIELIDQRMSIIPEVSQLKKNNNESFFIKSSREADMIKKLVNKVNNKFLKLNIVNIWRKIITMSNMEEQGLKIGIHNPRNIADYEYIVKEYFSQIVPVIHFDSATNLIAELERGLINIGIFLLPTQDVEDFDKKDTPQENWWINIANNRIGLKIYTKIPFFEFLNDKNKNNFQLVATAIKEAEQSEKDFTILSVETSSDFSKSQLVSLLKDSGFNFKILKTVKSQHFQGVPFYLIELEGFYLADNSKLKELSLHKSKPFVKVLGHYPAPIIID